MSEQQQTIQEITEEQSKFQSMVDEALQRSGAQLTGNVMMVEHLPDREVKTASGIVLAQSERQLAAHDSDRPHFVRVLAVGSAIDEDEYKKGQILLVPMTAVKYFTTFGAQFGKQFKYKPSENLGIGFMTDEQEWFKFDNYEAYRAFMEPFEELK